MTNALLTNINLLGTVSLGTVFEKIFIPRSCQNIGTLLKDKCSASIELIKVYKKESEAKKLEAQNSKLKIALKFKVQKEQKDKEVKKQKTRISND